MKAIINVNPKSAYAYLNMLTFPVKDFMPNESKGTAVFGVDINGSITDFSAKEIIIADIQDEYFLAKHTTPLSPKDPNSVAIAADYRKKKLLSIEIYMRHHKMLVSDGTAKVLQQSLIYGIKIK